MASCSSASSSSPPPPPPPSSSSSSNPLKYDVFLSFRGEDTRKNFTSYLYDALCRKQIETFIDNNELRRGDEISPSLSRAIQDSSLAIIVFSQNYASSSWCLNELLEILECMKTKGQIVLPVFYRVTPSEIRKQTGTYKTAFAEHEKRFKKTKDKVRSWRAALTQVANLSGWDLNQHDGTESDFVEKIAKDVLRRLNHMSSIDYFEGLVGITSRIESIESLLDLGVKNIVRIIGIWGMGGIGKTTIARAILIRIANQFESHCFLANVKDVAKYGPNHLQEKILNEIFEDRNVHINAFTLNRLRRKRVFIVLDDVDDLDHIDFLVRGHSSFGAGSRIIITSRDKQVLKNGVDELYELKELNYHEALELFSANAFKQNYPPENYTELSNRVIGYAKGNPLALKVLGRFLFDRSKLEWKSSLNKLKRCPNLKIQNVLKISYDGLDFQEKEIFLSIACFFKGEYKDRVVALLNDCGFYAEIGMAVLVDKCLLTITDDLLLMHDLIQEMGRGVVLQQSFDEPNNRSRLWDPKDIFVLFKKNMGTNRVESISLDLSQVRELQLSPDAFTKMSRLKFLKFYSSEYHEGYSEEDRVHLLQGLDLLPEELRYLHWHRYPLKSLPSNFNSERLIELEMPHSSIEHLLTENQPLENLRRIDLSYSQHLIEAPSTSQKRKQRSSVSFCFPGNEIPEWIEDQSDGSSITIDLPPHWYSDKFFGFALCIVAAFEDSNDLEDFFIEWKCNFIDNDDEWHEVVCHVHNVTIKHPVSNTAIFGCPKAEHVCFVAPNHELYEVYEEHDDDDGDDDDKGDSSFSVEKYSSCEEVFFQISLLDSDLCPLPNCKVSNCGVRLLYAEDMESIESQDDNVVSSSDQAEHVESERDGISNVEEEDPNLETNLETEDDHEQYCNCLLHNCFSFLFQRWN